MSDQKTYVTFSQSHTHRVNGKLFDCDCVAVVDGDRDRVFELFGPKFCFEYSDLSSIDMRYFPRGLINVETVALGGDA